VLNFYRVKEADPFTE